MTTTTNGAGRRISVEQAQLKTATVEVRSLTISGKQVTLAVFRQLLEEDILDRDAVTVAPRGEPWGRVNYCPGKGHCDLAGTGKAHTHLVWQLGDELRRCAVAAHMGPDDWLETRSEVGSAWERYVCALALREGKTPQEVADAQAGLPRYYKDAAGETSYWYHLRVDDLRVTGELYQRLPYRLEDARRRLGGDGEATDPEARLAALREAAAFQVEFDAAFEAWLRRVAALPQLFIAV